MGIDNKSLEGLAKREAAASVSARENLSITRTYRRTKYCTEIVEAICTALAAGISIRAACAQVNISEQTYYDWKDKYPEFNHAVNSTRPNFELQMLELIKMAAITDWRAAAWILQKRYPDAYGDKREVDFNMNKTDGTEQVLSFVKQVQDKLKSPADNS